MKILYISLFLSFCNVNQLNTIILIYIYVYSIMVKNVPGNQLKNCYTTVKHDLETRLKY